ncbi:MAG: acyl-CoA dehydrogenase [Acidimicrobiaceae bacterium]|nr:acyl-CoA dehydrogenase [Acidimicrobiaceae bacterium]
MSHGEESPAVAATARIASEIAAPAAASVDRDARFPKEAFDALREEKLLSALVPERFGGMGASLAEVARMVSLLSRQCASTGMIYAMHQIQVACLVRHGTTPVLEDYLRCEVVARQALLASATTEIGRGGDVRSSTCAVDVEGDHFRLVKQAPVISYGEVADAVLVTARRTPESPPNDQVLVLCRTPSVTLEPRSGWDTLGFRGTCSLGFLLEAAGSVDEILPQPYGDISAQTMLPTSHLLWASVWLGMADEALSRANAFVRSEARKTPDTLPPSAVQLAELAALHHQLAASVELGISRYCSIADDEEELTTMLFALEMNALKVSGSTLVAELVTRALQICGISGYREDSPYSLGRLLRDAYGAALMVSNHRINTNSAHMLLVAGR